MQKETLQRLKSDNRTMDEQYYCYSIRNSIFREADPVFFVTYIMPDVMDVLIYAIQKHYDDIAEENVPVLTHQEIADLLVAFELAMIVRDTHIPETIKDYRSFDMVDNWDLWDEYNDDIFSLPFFQMMNWEDLQERLYQLSWSKQQAEGL